MLNKNIFSERLKALRISKNLNQNSLANAIGIGKSAISMIETGQRAVSVDILVALADYFNVSLDYLTGTGLYSKEEQILTHKAKIVHALNQFYDTDFFTKVSAFPDRVFMNIVASAVKDIDFLDDEDAPEITLYPLVPAEAGRNFFSTLK